MSVICQNFVQNTWKKDLCSNCFKSLADHGSPYDPKMSLPPLSLHSEKNGVISSLDTNTRYISQATTVYQSRSLLSHCHSTWKSLLSGQPTTNGSPFRIENGFHAGKPLKLSSTNDALTSKQTNGDIKPISTSLKVNDTGGEGPDKLKLNGNGFFKEHEESVQGILKKDAAKRREQRRASVGFREEDPQVIGYGGRDYESDEAEWDISSDDGEFCLESLDVTEEDRAITKITKENTEFNSDNANLLRSIDIVESEGRKVESKQKEVAATSNGILETDSRTNQSMTIASCDKPDEGAESPSVIEAKNSNGEQQACQRLAEDEIKLAQFTSHAKEEQLYKRSLWPTAECLPAVSEQANQPSLLSDTSVTSTVIKERIAESSSNSNHTNVLATSNSSSESQTLSKSLPLSADKQVNSAVAKNQWSTSAPKEITSSPNNAGLSARSQDKEKEVNQTSDESGKRRASELSISAAKKSVTETSPQNVTGTTMPLNSRYRKLDITPRSSFLHGLSAKEPDSAQSPPNAIYSPGSDFFVSSNTSVTLTPTSNSTTSTPSTTLNSNASDYPPNSTSKKMSAPSVPTEIKEDKPVSCPSAVKGSSNASPDVDRYSWKPRVPSTKPAIPSTPPPPVEDSSKSDANRFKDDALHYAVGRTIANSSEVNANLPESNHYAESNIYQEITLNGSSPSPQIPRTEDGVRRENKLAALAMELEQVRCGPSSATKRQAPAPPPPLNPPEPCAKNMSAVTPSTPEQAARPVSIVSHSSAVSTSPSNDTKVQSQSPKSKSSMNESQYGRPKSSSSSSVTSTNAGSFKSRIPLIGDDGYKTKRGKFSLKKFLKLGKDSDSVDASNALTPNPKAWKNNSDFDRSKGKIEIIHPMDMVAKSPSSDNLSMLVKDDISQENEKDDGDYQRRRSASSSDILTYISGSVQSSSLSDREDIYDPNGEDIYDDNLTDDVEDIKGQEETEQASGSPEPEPTTSKTSCSKPTSPPGIKPTSTAASPATSPGSPPYPPLPPPSGTSSSGVRPSRPPKPPPPPRTRSVLPTGQQASPRRGSKDDHEFTVGNSSPKGSSASEEDHMGPTVPNRPPAPKRCCRQNIKSDYANLGDVRNPMAPKKPERSPSVGLAGSPTRDDDENENFLDDTENVYEPIDDRDYQTLEEHHHFDQVSSKNSKNLRQESCHQRQQGYVVFQAVSPGSQEQKGTKDSAKTSYQSREKNQNTRRKNIDMGSQGDDPNKNPPSHYKEVCCNGENDVMPWKTLEASYTAVVSANHEVFAKVLDQVLQEKALLLSKPDNAMLRWNDFDLESSEPAAILGNKVVYNATFKYEPKLQVSLLVVPHYLPNSSNRKFLRSVLLGWFVDQLPMNFIQLGVSHYFEATQATVYVLKRCKIQTLCNYYSDKMTSLPMDTVNLKEISFIVLQLIHALKIAQANGTEEVDSSPNSMVLVKAESDSISYLISDELDTPLEKRGSIYKKSTPDVVKMSLCQYAVMTLLHLLRMDKLDDLMSHTRSSRPMNASFACLRTFAALAQVLSQEKASSLSQAKSLLEYLLWGPRQITHKSTEDNELILQRWLDVERAQSLKSLSLVLGQLKSATSGDGINSLTTFQEFHYLFLLRTNARALKETAVLADFDLYF